VTSINKVLAFKNSMQGLKKRNLNPLNPRNFRTCMRHGWYYCICACVWVLNSTRWL